MAVSKKNTDRFLEVAKRNIVSAINFAHFAALHKDVYDKNGEVCIPLAFDQSSGIRAYMKRTDGHLCVLVCDADDGYEYDICDFISEREFMLVSSVGFILNTHSDFLFPEGRIPLDKAGE